MESEKIRELWEGYTSVSSNPLSKDSKVRSVELKKLHAILVEYKMQSTESCLRDDRSLSFVSEGLVGEFEIDLTKISCDSEEDDLSKLQHYLTSDCGAIILKILSLIGISEAVNSHKLGGFVIWLLPLCLKFTMHASDDSENYGQLSNIYTYFDSALHDQKSSGRSLTCEQHLAVGRRRHRQNVSHGAANHWHQSSPFIVGASSSSSSSTSRVRQVCRARRQKELDSKLSDSESEDDVTVRLQMPSVQRRCVVPDLVAATAAAQGAASGGAESSVESEQLTVLNVAMLLLKLLQDIVLGDVQGFNESSTCMQLAPSVGALLGNVVSRSRFEKSPFPALSESTVFFVCSCLTRIFFLMLIRVGKQNSGLKQLRRFTVIEGTASVVLEHVEFLMTSRMGKQLVFDFTAACWLYARGLLLLHSANVIVINDLSKAIELVTRGRGLDLSQRVLVDFCSSGENSGEFVGGNGGVVELIRSIVSVTMLLKSMRSHYIHTCTCGLRSHQFCTDTTAVPSWHHHDVLGLPCCAAALSPASGQPSSASGKSLFSCTQHADKCIISTVVVFLLGVYRQSSSEIIRHCILDVLEQKLVLCCCVPPQFFVDSLCIDVETSDANLKKRSFSVVVDIYVKYFSIEQKHTDCLVCSDINRLVSTAAGNELSTGDSVSVCPLSDSVQTTCDSPSVQSSCISRLLTVTCSGDSQFALFSLSHVIRLAEYCCEATQKCLFEQFFMPVFAAVLPALLPKDIVTYTVTLSDNDAAIFLQEQSAVMKLCLHGLSFVLRSSVVRGRFYAADCVSVCAELAENDDARRHALAVLLVLVCQEERELINDADRTDESDTASTTSSWKPTVNQVIDLLFRYWKPSSDGKSYIATQLSSDQSCLSRLAQIWSLSVRLFVRSLSFRCKFMESGGYRMAQHLLLDAMGNFFHTGGNCNGPEGERAHSVGNRDDRDSLTVIYSCLFICLRSGKFAGELSDSEDNFSEVFMSTSAQLARSGVSSKSLHQFCRLLLTCAADTGPAEYFLGGRCLDVESVTDDWWQHQHVDESRYLMDIFTLCYNDEQGYDGDHELSSLNYQDPTHQMGCDVLPIQLPATKAVFYPWLCRLVLQIISEGRCHNGERIDAAILADVLYWLIPLARSNQAMAIGMHKQNVVGILLNGFKHWLVSSDPNGSVVQRSLMELFLLIATHGISTGDMKVLLKLFDEKEAPVGLILSTLVTLSSKQALSSTFSLRIPSSGSKGYTDGRVLLPSEFPASVNLPTLTTTLRKSQEVDISACLSDSDGHQPVPSSVVTCTALGAKWTSNVLWPSRSLSVFSFSMWFLIETGSDAEADSCPRPTSVKRNSASSADRGYTIDGKHQSECKSQKNLRWSDVCTHIVSVGNSEIMLELWLNQSSSYLVARLVTIHNDVMTIESQARVTVNLSHGQWHHITLAYSESAAADRSEAVVVSYVNGDGETKAKLSYKQCRSSVAVPLESCIYIGHAVKSCNKASSPSKFCQLGNLFLLRDLLITCPMSCYLYALGPDCCTLASCDSSEQTVIYTNYLNNVLSKFPDVIYDLLGSGDRQFADKLGNSVAVTYIPSHTSSITVSEHPTTLSGGSKSNATSCKSVLLSAYGQIAGAVQPRVHSGLAACLRQIGGMRAFLYLFAKIVEKEQTEQEQAKALQLIFCLIQNNIQLADDFKNSDGYSMLKKVFMANRCIMSYEMLKVLTDSCTTSPVIHRSVASNGYRLVTDNVALVCDATVISDMILAWRAWERSSSAVWLLALEALASLVRPNHPHRRHNVEQLSRVDVIGRLLDICKERLQESRPSLPVPLCNAMLELIRSIVGSQLSVHNVINICDFLLLMHPAASTYVHQNKTKFWFRNKWIVSCDGVEPPVSVITSSPGGSYQQPSSVGSYDDRTSIDGLAQRTKLFNRASSLPPNSVDRIKGEAVANSAATLRTNSADKIPGFIGQYGDSIRTIESPFEPEVVIAADHHSLDVAVTNDELSDERRRHAVSKPLDVKLTSAVQSSYSVTDDGIRQTDMMPKEGNDGSVNYAESPLPDVVTMCARSNEDKRGFDVVDNSVCLHSHRNLQTEDTSKFEKFIKSEIGTNGPICVSTPNKKYATRAVSRADDDTMPLTYDGREFDLDADDAAAAAVGVNDESKDITAVKHSRLGQLPEQVDALDQSLLKSSLNTSVDSGDDGLVHIIAGLFDLLGQLLHTVSDIDHDRLFRMILRPSLLVVMVNHSSIKIRIAIIQFFRRYWMLLGANAKTEFEKSNGFQLLANQLHQLDVNSRLVEVTVQLLMGLEDFKLSDLTNTMQFAQERVSEPMFAIVLMGLIERTVSSSEVCRTVIGACTKVFSWGGRLAAVMLNNGLAEVLCNVIHRLYHLSSDGNDSSDDNSVDENIAACDFDLWPVIQDLQQLFSCIAFTTFTSSGEMWYNHFKGTFGLLQSLEARLKDLYGKNSDVVRCCSSIQCNYFRTVLQYFDGQLNDFSRLLACRASRVSVAASDSGSTDQALTPSLLLSEVLSRASIAASGSDSIISRLLGSGWLRKKDGQRSTESATLLPASEMTDRFKKAITLSVNFSLFCIHRNQSAESQSRCKEAGNDLSSNEGISAENQFTRYLLEFLLKALITCFRNGSTRHDCPIAAVLWNAKDVLREQFSRLLVDMFSPSSGLEQQLFVLSFLTNDSYVVEVLKKVISIKLTGQKLASYCYDLVIENSTEMTTVHRREAGDLLEMLQQLDIPVVKIGSQLSTGDKAAMALERKAWRLSFDEEQNKWLQSHGLTLQKVLHRLDDLLSRSSEQAMEMTKAISSTQNVLRRNFVDEIKQQMSAALQIKKAWLQTIMLLTHERAIWYSPQTYPPSWELDLTEGPSRMRRRLQRCYLQMKPEFLLPEQRHKLVEKDIPLSYLFDHAANSSESAVLIYKLCATNSIEYVTPQATVDGSLLIGHRDIFFVADTAVTESSYIQQQALLGNRDTLFMTLPHDQIQEFHKQWYLLKDNALEIFLASGKTSLLALNSTKERDDLYAVLASLELPNLQPASELLVVQQRWLSGQMTNFDYLTQINKMAGRSLNDLMQYPIFPFIFAQYDKRHLDLTSVATYRTLSKTISTQTKEMEDKYVGIYRTLSSCQQMDQVDGSTDGVDDIMTAPYHYSNHCSNVCTVLQFLVRLPPFTQLFIAFQDNHFDIPDRTFHSMAKCYDLVTVKSVTDTKELIPEFFYLPEFLENNEGFDFGIMQNNERVDAVTLPPWCHGDARLFTLIHRQGLESEIVRQSLPGWIDLVFGFKQRGKAAVDAVNVFHPSSYFGVQVDSIFDPLKRNAVRTMIRTTGQTPKQLFASPHPIPASRGVVSAGKSHDKVSPIQQITGLRWGDYLGSPDWPDPVVVWSSEQLSACAKLAVLTTGEVCGMNKNSCLLTRESAGTQKPVNVEWMGILSWNHADSIVKVRQSQRRNYPLTNFLHWPSYEQITCCTGVSDCRLLFFGSDSGVISVFNTLYNPRKEFPLQVFDRRLCLFGHSTAVSCLQVCKPFSVLVSASLDGVCIIWDLNRLDYVRSMADHESQGVVALCISSLSGDIASASHSVSANTSCLTLHTINGKLVSRVICSDFIRCLTFSPAPEGQSVNMIAAGMSNGKVRLWSSWTLTPITELASPTISSGICSLIYTNDGHYLYCATNDRLVHVWGKSATSARNKQLLFVSYVV